MTDTRLARHLTRVLTSTGIVAPTAVQTARTQVRILYALVAPVSAAGVQVWNGTAFVTAPVKAWDGTTFVDAVAVRTFNGTSFV